MKPFPKITERSNYRTLLPKWEELTDQEKRGNSPFCRALNGLFFNGGRLEDFGIKPKPGVDIKDVRHYVRATLGDWGPKHEHKIGGIAHMLNEWCVIEAPDAKP